MRHRVTTLAVVFAGAVALAATPDDPKPGTKLAPKDFTEKIASVKTDENTKKDEPLKAEFEMVYVKGGEFTMGSPPTEAGREEVEGPAHKVKVGNFWMQKCEVSWDAYDVFWFDNKFLVANDVRAKDYKPDAVTRPTNTYVDETYEHGRDGHPAICMSHHAAMVYCQWLKTKTGKNYRLPTEAEWEFACRAGSRTAYSFGDDPKGLAEVAWYTHNSPTDEVPSKPKGTSRKVGTMKPNAFGLHDLHGNVWEWTLDQYDPQAYAKFAKNPLSLRPVTVPTDEKFSHVVRGGSFADTADRLRSAARRVSDKSWMKYDPQEPQSIWWLTRMDVVGFRVVLAEDEQPELVGLAPKVVKKSD